MIIPELFTIETIRGTQSFREDDRPTSERMKSRERRMIVTLIPDLSSLVPGSKTVVGGGVLFSRSPDSEPPTEDSFEPYLYW